MMTECCPNDFGVISDVAFAYSNQKDAQCIAKSYEYYDRSLALKPDSETNKKNLVIVEKQLLNKIIQLGKEKNAKELRPIYDRYRNLAGQFPEKAGMAMIRDRAESELALSLSQNEDLESKLESYEFYRDLSERQPEVLTHVDNLRIMRSQVAIMYYRAAEAGDKEAAKKAFALYSQLGKDYPERDYAKYANYIKNHFM